MADEHKGGLQKKQVFKVEDTNVALLGSDLDKQCRLAAAKTEKAWTNAGKAVGLHIWRIEKFQVVTSKTPAGVFYNDDSYIVLNTYKKDPNNAKLSHDVHFWLGATTSQDEAGTAAYKTVELDDLLGGEPVQHREVSGHEGELFLSYFPAGVRLLEGGVESGFRHVAPEAYVPRLLHIKGKKRPRVTQVAANSASMNIGDVFLLDAGLTIYQWNGRKSGAHEKNRASTLARALDDERGGKPVVKVYAQGDKDEHEFWDALGSPAAGVSEVEGDDEAWEKDNTRRLIQVSIDAGDAAGSDFQVIKEGPFGKGDLVSDDVMIADVGDVVFVWIGRGSNAAERKTALGHAQTYLAKYNRPAWIPITRIFEDGENEVFNAHLV